MYGFGSAPSLPPKVVINNNILCVFFFSFPRNLQVAEHGATVRRTARAAGRTYPNTRTFSTGPCTRRVITVPAPCTSYRPSWAAVARISAPPPISSGTPSGACVRPTSNWRPTGSPAYVSAGTVLKGTQSRWGEKEWTVRREAIIRTDFNQKGSPSRRRSALGSVLKFRVASSAKSEISQLLLN